MGEEGVREEGFVPGRLHAAQCVAPIVLQPLFCVAVLPGVTGFCPPGGVHGWLPPA